MKFLPLLAALAATAWLFAAEPAAVTYVNSQKVTEIFAKGGPLASGSDFTTTASRRTGPGQVEVHEKETDIFYVTDGEATFVAGGTMVGGKQSKQAQWLGTDIQGGTTYHLAKGDVMTIPAGVPHWFKEVPKSVNYLVVKVLKP